MSIGSHRVVTINLPHIAYQSKTHDEYLKNLTYNVELAQDLLDAHRKLIIKEIEEKKLPLYTYGYMSLQKQYSTIGFIGMNEAVEQMGMDIIKEDGTNFAKEILKTINALNEKRTAADHNIRNIEQVPGESAAVDFAKIDKILYPKQCKYDLYANQFIPLWTNVDLTERARLQGIFDSSCNGGAICHINIDSEITHQQMEDLIKYVCKTGTVYWAINIALTRCKTCNKLFIGKFDKSPCHHSDVERYLRVVGFITPVSSWIPERRKEYDKRQFYAGKTVAK
jgi:ribonucleoside-triphosphate reductase